MIGKGELIIILLIALVLFGAGKIPSIMSDLAKGVRSFKKEMKKDDDDEAQPESEITNIEAESDNKKRDINKKKVAKKGGGKENSANVKNSSIKEKSGS